MKIMSIALAALIAHTSVYAEEKNTIPQETYSISGILGAGYGFGGDRLASASFSDGSSESVKAGDGIWLDFGFKTQFVDWSLKSSIGYKEDSVSASNGDLGFSRIPLTFIGSYANGDHSFGAGFTYEISPKLDVNIPGGGFELNFKDSTGIVLEYEKLENTWGWGVRYTIIDYQVDSNSGNTEADGNNLGIFANWYF